MARAGTAQGLSNETRTFPTKGLATAWAATTESNMLAMKHQDVRIIAKMTLADLIDVIQRRSAASNRSGRTRKPCWPP
jgi:hypothetical protein